MSGQELARFEELAATRNRMSLERRNGGRVRHLCNFFSDCKAEFAAAITDDMRVGNWRALRRSLNGRS